MSLSFVWKLIIGWFHRISANYLWHSSSTIHTSSARRPVFEVLEDRSLLSTTGALLGPINGPIGAPGTGFGGISCDGDIVSDQPIVNHGAVVVDRTPNNELVVNVTLRSGDPWRSYTIELFEAADTCSSDDAASTGFGLATDGQGNGQTLLVLRLPHSVAGHGTIGDGIGSESIIVVLDYASSSTGSGDRFSTHPIPIPEAFPDITPTQLTWNTTEGGVDFSYEVIGADLAKDTTAALYWANGTGITNVIGNPIFTTVVQKTEGKYGPIHVARKLLRNPPGGTTHILVVVDPQNNVIETDDDNNGFALQDVKIEYQSDARQILSDYTLGVIKDALRFAGQSSGLITSTYRTPREQAEAMYRNILATSPKAQKKLYGDFGDKVIIAYQDAKQAYEKAPGRSPAD